MENPNYYAILPANVRYDDNLKDKAKLLYAEITSLSNKDGKCWASNRYFAELYNVTTTTISLLIKNLVDQGYLETELIYKEGTKEILKRYLKIIKYPTQKNLKENNTSIILKKNNKEEEENIINFYENNIGLITAYVIENIKTYIEDGLEADLIIQAMKEAVNNNARNWNYVKSILNDCLSKNIKNKKEYEAAQVEYKNKKKKLTTTPKKQEVQYNTDFSEYDKYVKTE